jgi:hypothetical protein
MESNNQELPPTPPEVDLYAAALRFGFFLRNKLHTDTPAVHMIKDIGFNVQGITERAHEFELKSATCWWMPGPEGAVGVFMAPLRSVWFDKHRTKLNLNGYTNKSIGVGFANLDGTGIPRLASHFGLLNREIDFTKPMTILHLEPGESAAIRRAHTHWATITFKCIAATIYGQTEPIYAKEST